MRSCRRTGRSSSGDTRRLGRSPGGSGGHIHSSCASEQLLLLPLSRSSLGRLLEALRPGLYFPFPYVLACWEDWEKGPGRVQESDPFPGRLSNPARALERSRSASDRTQRGGVGRDLRGPSTYRTPTSGLRERLQAESSEPCSQTQLCGLCFCLLGASVLSTAAASQGEQGCGLPALSLLLLSLAANPPRPRRRRRRGRSRGCGTWATPTPRCWTTATLPPTAAPSPRPTTSTATRSVAAAALAPASGSWALPALAQKVPGSGLGRLLSPADLQDVTFALWQALGDRNREPGRLYDLEYESDDEAEEEKVTQNPSKPR